jgi:hypothetical protein
MKIVALIFMALFAFSAVCLLYSAISGQEFFDDLEDIDPITKGEDV